jgi:hypothetical protein
VLAGSSKRFARVRLTGRLGWRCGEASYHRSSRRAAMAGVTERPHWGEKEKGTMESVEFVGTMGGVGGRSDRPAWGSVRCVSDGGPRRAAQQAAT